MDCFSILNYFVNLKNKKKETFGLFLSPGMKFIRKKIKDEFIDDFTIENFLNILGGDDNSVYYSNKIVIEQFLGVELRFKEPLKIDSNELIFEVTKNTKKKKKIFNMMRDGGFKFLEIIPSKENNIPMVISLLWEKNNVIFFGPKDSMKLFFEFIDKNAKQEDKSIVFYISNLEFVFPSLLLMGENTDGIDAFALKNTIYFVKIFKNNRKLIFKNINLFFRGSLENLKSNGILTYEFLGYYPGTKKKYNLSENWSLCIKSEEDRKMDNLLRPKWVTAENTITNYFIGEKELTLKEINEQILNLNDILKKNLMCIQFCFLDLNREISKIHKRWYFNYSMASVSIEIFNKRFNIYNLKIESKSIQDSEIREAYIGGRCEVFGNAYSNETVYHFDFESMYGQVMLKDFPTGTLKKIQKPYDISRTGFYYVKVVSKGMQIPILPLKKLQNEIQTVVCEENKNEGIFFANGVFEGLYYSEELELFIEQGGVIQEILYGYVFDGLQKPIFKPFAEKIIELKKKNKSSVWKEMLVSLYGRLGMSPTGSSVILGKRDNYMEIIKDKTIIQETWINDYFLCEIRVEKKETVNSKVCLAAVITSRARIKLWKAMRDVELEGGRILYCDTDSIFAAFNSNKKVLNKRMGEVFWDEKKNSLLKNSVFAGQRTYSIVTQEGWETKMAGLPRNSITFDEFKENFYLNALKNYVIKTKKKNLFQTEEWETLIRINLDLYNKRRFSLDKKSTKPLYYEKEYFITDPFL